MAQVTLTIPAISCGHCARTITNALAPIAGVRQVRVDIPRQQVRVDYDETSVTVDQLTTPLAGEDYPVASIDGGPASDGEPASAAGTSEASAGCACCQPAAGACSSELTPVADHRSA